MAPTNAIALCVLVVGLIIWVGGATTGQVLLARAWARRDFGMAVSIMRAIPPLILRLYIRAGTLAMVAPQRW